MEHKIGIRKMVWMLTFIGILLATQTLAEDVFENSTNLCEQRCKCNMSDNEQTLYINCANTKMQHTIANWPKHPKNLVASFRNNDIVTLERMPGSGATDIKLVFSNNQIKYLETGLFESSINVKYVDLSHNHIESEQLSADVFKGPYNNSLYEPIALEYLDLSYNEIHSLQKNLFEHMPNLKYLNLEGNAMRIIDHVTCLSLSKLTNIQILNLANNEFAELPADVVKHFPQLTDINLSYNKLKTVPETLGFVASSLQVLNISNNPIAELDHSSFLGMENLLKLFANSLHQLTQIKARAFTPLKCLKILLLSNNKRLVDINEEAFHKIEELEEVYLNNNGLTTIPVNLLQWNSLKTIDISNNNFVCNCDLFHISSQISENVKPGNILPYCINPRTSLSMDVYLLTNDTCALKPEKSHRGTPYMNSNLKFMKITLVILLIVVVLGAFVAIMLGYTRWKAYTRSVRFPFPNHILYSPISTSEVARF